MAARLVIKNLTDDRFLLAIMEYGTYLFLVLLFAGKFGTLREIGFYVPALIWLLRAVVRRDPGFQMKEPVFVTLLLVLISAVVSSLLNSLPLDTLFLVKKTYLKTVLLYCVLSTVFSETVRLKRLALVLAVTGIVYECAAFYTMASGLIRAGEMDYEGIRNYSTILLFFLPFIGLQYFENSGSKRALWSLPFIGSFTGIVLTGVRGSFLALLGVLLVWMYFIKGSWSNVTKRFGTGISLVAVIVVVIFLVFPGQYRMVRTHLLQKVQITDRFEAWTLFLEMSQRKPLFGHGLNDKELPELYREFYRAAKGEYPSPGKPTSPHNQFIKIFYEQGMVGLTAYILLIGTLFYRVRKRFRVCSHGIPALVVVAALSVVAGEYVIRCLSEDRMLIPLGVLVGIAGAYLNLTRKDLEEEPT